MSAARLGLWKTLMVRNNLIFGFSIKFRSLPDVTPSSSAMEWFVLCLVHDNRNIFLYYSIFFQMHFHVFVQGPRFTSVCGSWKYACSNYS